MEKVEGYGWGKGGGLWWRVKGRKRRRAMGVKMGRELRVGKWGRL